MPYGPTIASPKTIDDVLMFCVALQKVVRCYHFLWLILWKKAFSWSLPWSFGRKSS